MAMAKAENTGRKDAKGRAIFKGPRGGEFVVTSSGKKSKPSVGRLTKKQLEAKAKNLSAKRQTLESKATNLSAKRQTLESKAKNLSAKRQILEQGAEMLNQEAARMRAENTMRRLNAVAAKKSANVKKAVKNM
jgi:uncharacterized coiled-coil DUF342 family protein